MKKDLLFVIDSLHSGGAEKSLVSLLSTLDYNKFNVDLLLFNKSGLYIPLVPKQVNILEVPEYFEYSGEKKDKKRLSIMIARIKNSVSIRNPYYKKKYHGAQITCKNILKTLDKQVKKYDVAIAYSQGLPTYYVSEKVEADKKLCWINTDYKKAGYNPSFDRSYYEKYNYMIAVSEKNKEVLESVYPEFRDKMRVIYDIISDKLVTKMANEGQGYTDKFDGIRILTIGRHVYLKGYDMAIEAAKLLKEDGINFRWYSIGEGILTEELKQKVKENGLEDNFIFLGTYINPYPFVKECDIYCQPSRFEGFGMAIAEAKILTKPIVTTDFNVVYDQIEDKKNGLIVKMNSKSIYNGIIKFINNSSLKEMLIANLLNSNIKMEENICNLYELIN